MGFADGIKEIYPHEQFKLCGADTKSFVGFKNELSRNILYYQKRYDLQPLDFTN